MIKKHYEDITSIECDCCLNEEFIPDEDEDRTELSIIWEQADNMGWKKLEEEGEVYHFCPNCVIQVFKETEYENRDQPN
jgi:hypothetical protein